MGTTRIKILLKTMIPMVFQVRFALSALTNGLDRRLRTWLYHFTAHQLKPFHLVF